MLPTRPLLITGLLSGATLLFPPANAAAAVAAAATATAAVAAAATSPALTRDNTLTLEPERFLVTGTWRKEGGHLLSAGKRGSVAFSGFVVPKAGEYRVWTLARDFAADKPAWRHFRIKIDDTPAERLSGVHKTDAWRWEHVLTLRLDAGPHMLEVEDLGRDWARLDSILLTTTNLDPNSRVVTQSLRARHAARLIPPRRLYEGTRLPEPLPPPPPAPLPPTTATDLAQPERLSNGDIEIIFRTIRAPDGTARVWREIAFPANTPAAANIAPADLSAGAEPLFVLHSSNDKSPRRPMAAADFYPGWTPATTTLWAFEKRILTPEPDPQDPWAAGILRRLNPVSVRRVSENAVALVYRETQPVPAAPAGSPASASTPGALACPLEATIVWTLPARGHAVRLDAEFGAPETAWYSLAFGAGQPAPPSAVHAVQLPPMFQFRRLPETPVLLPSVNTPHPLALVEKKSASTPVATPAASPAETAATIDAEISNKNPGLTTGVIAAGRTVIPDPQNPEKTPDWFGRENSACGFTLTSPDGNLQPVVFSPLLGYPDSRIQKTVKLRRSWWVISTPGSWSEAMREADTDIQRLRDYREPVSVSLSEQALNLIDLLDDDTFSGWSARHKGPLNIEAANGVTHAAPLAYLSAANITRDEKFFARRALPALEFLLTRPGTHFSLRTDNVALDFERRPYSSAVWQGAAELLGGANPWLADDYAFPGGAIRKVTRSPSRAPEWSDLLALYRHNPSPGLLEKIRAQADNWLASVFIPARQTRPLDIGPFYNAGNFYPYWWDLPDLAELTGAERYRQAAARGAELTIAGLWTHPAPPAPPASPALDRNPAEMLTLHPGGQVSGTWHVWYMKDGSVGRIGFPMTNKRAGDWQTATLAIPQKRVPAWTVSPVGLGLEQPVTYVRNAGDTGRYHNILLSVWAANLLRVADATRDDWMRAFARNTLIGRGGSYPGYYIADYSDLLQNPDYPRRGPELNTFYWHHIPVHLMMVLDYLFTDAELRTGGQVSFPYVKQQGYAWFSARVFGGKPGRVFEDRNVRPWLDRTRRLFRVETKLADGIGARSDTQFHLVLLNQAQTPIDAPVTIDAGKLGLKRGPDGRVTARLRDARGEVIPLAFSPDGRATVPLDKNGWAVLSLDAAPDTFPLAPPPPPPLSISAAPQTFPLGEPWGNLRVFRIRAPFGHDAIYAALDGKIPPGSRAELLPGKPGSPATAAVDRAPYELDVYPYDSDKTAAFTLRLTTADGRQTKKTFQLPAQ
ncbi:MAG: hypothetical protein LBK99_02140 [Opitutaceae bacterium]|jgi:hypothetical protein|nr:hypothetical protein [Opitutaceae bacterium]